MFITTNPYSKQKLAEYSYFSFEEIEKVLSFATTGSRFLVSKTPAQRGELLLEFAQNLQNNRDILGQLITSEMGKPFRDSLAEIDKSISACRFMATQGAEWSGAGRRGVLSQGSFQVNSQHLGPVLAIMPWNFPIWQLIRVLAPSVLLGNSIILKHSDLTAGTAESISRLFDFCPGVLVNLRVQHENIEKIIADRRVRAVTLTGSVRAGSQVAMLAGKHLKKSVLELGGSDPSIVLPSADLESSAKLCAQSRLLNSGQSCISAKRFFIHKDVFNSWVTLFEQELEKPGFGNPGELTTELGPLAHERFHHENRRWIDCLPSLGLKDFWHSKNHQCSDSLFPTRAIFVGTGREAVFAQEELFSPIALVAPFSYLDEAIELANSSRYGLGASIYCENSETEIKMAAAVAKKIEAGMVAINDFVRSDVKFPFGGFKDSGYGRELGPEGFLEFAGTQVILTR